MSLKIVGGIYRERTIFPADDVIFGSGGRAAYALKALDPNLSLISFVGNKQRAAISYNADKIWDIPLEQYSIPEIVTFTYYHGLSTPLIRPTRLPFSSAPFIEVKGGAILQFGMLEGDAKVYGDRVVFDPQNPESPERFHASGSTANELAYVLNRGEAQKLTDERNPDHAAAKLLAEPGVAVVIIKCGADGARVFTNSDELAVAAYETERVWPIGSGDVFAAAFAHFWALKQLSAFESAKFAAKGAALYCNSRTLPLSPGALNAEPFPFDELSPKRKPEEASIYLAGPFFSMSQLWLVEQAKDALQDAGFNVFSPFHDVGIGEEHHVVPKDIQGIEDANALLALCDGLDPGTLFEAGFAVKKGIPVVAFGEQTSNESMKMLRGTGCKVFKDFASTIYHTQWEALK